MSNFGFAHLRVVNPYHVAFREARSAIGASALLASAKEYNSVADAVADCTLVVGTTAVGHRDLQLPLRSLKQGASLVRKRLGSGKTALLFGSEKVGLSNEDLNYCNWLINIPTHLDNFSMNLGQAVAVCLYELVRGSSIRESFIKEQVEKQGLATAGDIERISVLLLETLQASGYVKSRAATESKVRRMIRSLNLEASDAAVWLGMLRQILWKLQSRENQRAEDCAKFQGE
jgi:TrmH family RNA methyltransferase